MGNKDYHSSKENRPELISAHKDASPDKSTLKEMLQEQSLELSSSRAALLQMLAAQTERYPYDHEHHRFLTSY